MIVWTPIAVALTAAVLILIAAAAQDERPREPPTNPILPVDHFPAH